MAVADSFDAMTSDRPYRKALSAHQAIQTLLEGRGTQWEPAVVNVFVDMVVRHADEEAQNFCPNCEDHHPSRKLLSLLYRFLDWTRATHQEYVCPLYLPQFRAYFSHRLGRREKHLIY